MPRTRSLAWSELRVGILSVFAIVVSAMLVFSVGQQGGFFWQLYELRTSFEDIRGLKGGAVVRVAGVEVGTVDDIRFDGATVQVIMKVSRDMQNRITTESRASIGSLSMLGEPVIDITASITGEVLGEGSYLQSETTGAQLTEVALTATRGLEEATLLLDEIRQGRGTVGKLLADETLYEEILSFIRAAEKVASNLNEGNGTIGAMLKSPKAYKALESSLIHLNGVMARLDKGEGGLGRLVTDEEFSNSISSTVSSFDAVGEKINTGEGTLGRLLNEGALYEKLDSLTTHLDKLTESLNAGEGTAGQLLRDRALYENMNEAVGEFRDLVIDIRKDPKKYLNVRVSIF